MSGFFGTIVVRWWGWGDDRQRDDGRDLLAGAF